MCRNDAAREEVLRDHQDKSLLSKKDETPEICTGQDFHLLQTWSLPSTGGKHKGCQHWSECCDSAGQPRCRTYRREDEGRVSRSHSTRKQLPGQSAGLSGYSQLIPTPPEEGYAPDPFLLQGICSERRGGISHTFTNHLQSSEGLLPTTALLSHTDSTVAEQGTPTQVHFSPLASVLLASDFIAESHKKGFSSPFPKRSRFPGTGNSCNSKNAAWDWGEEETIPKSKQCRDFVNIQEI